MKQLSDSRNFRGEPDAIESPLAFLMWASRTYVWHTGQDCAVPDSLRLAFEVAGVADAYHALQRTFDRLLATAASDIVLHAPGCPANSEIEQAFIMAIRCLQREDSFGYVVTMAAVAPPATARLVRPDMQTLASMLSSAERRWPGDVEDWHSRASTAGRNLSRFHH